MSTPLHTSRISRALIVSARIALATALVAAPAAAQTFGSTVTNNGAGPFGRDATDPNLIGAFAQTFVAPVGSPLLRSFTFVLGDFIGGTDFKVQANVFVFSSNRIVGPALLSGNDTYVGSTNSASFDARTSPMLNLLLTPGTTYALVLRTAGTSVEGATNFLGTSVTESFSLGSLFTSTRSAIADLSTAGAFMASTDADASVSMTFAPANVSTVPEPSSVALIAVGFAGVLLFARRRARAI